MRSMACDKEHVISPFFLIFLHISPSQSAYTFDSVRWATQKGDIFRVRAQEVAQLGGGRDNFFFDGVCVAQLKIRGQGKHYSNFKSEKIPITIVFCHEME